MAKKRVEVKHRRTYNSYYSVYDIHTDELVICGTVADICKRLDITKSTVCRAVTESSTVRRRYRIYFDGENE